MKALYRDLDLESVYYKYEEETHKQIKDLISKVDHIPHEVRKLMIVLIVGYY